MARIIADLQVCQGYGNCVDSLPDFFDLSNDDRVVILRVRFDEADRPAVERAVRSCPVTALAIVDE